MYRINFIKNYWPSPTTKLATRLSMAALMLLVLIGCRSMPESQSGAEAEELADKMLAAINYEAWENDTAAVSWTFRGAHDHFWDKERGLVQVSWDEYRVQFNKATMAGIAFENEMPVTDEALLAELVAQANAFFVNDAFWLNPLFHMNSPGATRELVEPGVLKVYFSSGGVTPGDTYVFYTDADGLVTEMRLWVSIVPFKGLGADFTEYQTTDTGVQCATVYEYLITIDIGDLKMFAEYPAGGAEDIFADFPYAQ